MHKYFWVGLPFLFLCCAMCAGCGDTLQVPAAQEGTETLSVAAETESDTEETVRVSTGLPDDLDFEGHTFTILNNDYSIPLWSQKDIAAEEMTGDTINDAVYQRNLAVTDTYNCEIVSEQTLDLAGKLQKTVKAGDSVYDLATPYLRTFSSLAENHYLLDMTEISSIDMSKPWFDQNGVSELSVAGRLYGVISELTLMDKQSTTAMVFNKQLYGTYGFDDTYGDFYQLVLDGRWTYDTLCQMTRSVSGDLDGDGEYTGSDLFGLLYQRDSLTSYFNGFGAMCMMKDEDDLPYMTVISDENVKILDDIFDLIYDERYSLNVMAEFSGDTWSDEMVKVFEENRALFMWIRIADVENLRTMDVDFGILPIPKYNEQQESYKISVNPYVGAATAIPVSNYDPVMTGYFLTAISAESYYTLLPAYYEVNLKGKISRDEESAQMLDIIFSNRVFDLGQILDPGNFSDTMIYMTMNGGRDIASKYAKSEKKITKALDKIITAFTED